MTNTDLLLRVNENMRSGDVSDLLLMMEMVDGFMMADDEKGAWKALLETAVQAVEGEFC